MTQPSCSRNRLPVACAPPRIRLARCMESALHLIGPSGFAENKDRQRAGARSGTVCAHIGREGAVAAWNGHKWNAGNSVRCSIISRGAAVTGYLPVPDDSVPGDTTRRFVRNSPYVEASVAEPGSRFAALFERLAIDWMRAASQRGRSATPELGRNTCHSGTRGERGMSNAARPNQEPGWAL